MSAGWRGAPLVDDAIAATLAEDLGADDLAQVYAALAEDITLRAGQLAEALAVGAADPAYRAVHSLKGAALNLGFLRLGQLCAHLQIPAQAGRVEELVTAWGDFIRVCNDSLARLGHTSLVFEMDSSIVRD